MLILLVHLFMIFKILLSYPLVGLLCCSPENLTALKDWIKQLPSQGIDSVDCGSDLLDAPQVDAIEKAIKDTPVKVG